MTLVVGTYPVDPAGPVDSRRFYDALDRSGLYGALELPVDRSGVRALPSAVPSAWSLVLTAIPGTMHHMGDDPSFGLASTNDAGRRRALAFTAAIRDDVIQLTEKGRRVLAVQLHSAPRGSGSAASLHASLTQVAGWDWAGARLTLEHCDALVPDHAPEKGFLTLDDEIDVVRLVSRETGVPVGITVNWARSVIETRNAHEAVDHVRRAADAGVLVGVMFSSCAGAATEFGYPWIDAHLPAREVPGAPEASLLTAGHIADCLAAAGSPRYTGLKIDLRPRDLPAQERAARLNAMAATVTEVAPVALEAPAAGR